MWLKNARKIYDKYTGSGQNCSLHNTPKKLKQSSPIYQIFPKQFVKPKELIVNSNIFLGIKDVTLQKVFDFF